MKHSQFLQDILNGQSLVTPRDIIQGLLAHGEEYEIIADMIEAIYMDEDRPASFESKDLGSDFVF